MPATGLPKIVRSASVVLLAVFAAWIAGVVWWNSAPRSSDQEPILGDWTNEYVASHRSTFTVHADGTFERVVNGQKKLGTWKPVKAWKADGRFQYSHDRSQPVLKYHLDEDMTAYPFWRDPIFKGTVRPVANAYLMDDGVDSVVIWSRDRDGERLDSDDLDWTCHRPTFSDWLADLRSHIIPERTP